MDSAQPAYLADLSSPEASDALQAHPIGLLPVGAIEAHGPHLPLNTDVIIAQATAETAWRLLHAKGAQALILPEILYSVSFAGLPFAGTTPVAADVFEEYVTDVLTYHGRQGYSAIVCCNAHLEPEHVDALLAACEQAGRRCDIPFLFPDQRAPEISQYLGEEFRGGSRHAGAYETSVVLASRPDAVRLALLQGLQPVWIDLPARLREGARTFRDAGADDGYFGDPANASVEQGQALLQSLGEMIVNSCRAAGVLQGS